MTSAHPTTALPAVARPLGLKLAGALAGTLAVALAAQASVPLPGTPVPMTLQPLAVLIVGGLLGPRYGALSMVMYLALGAAGLPVFTPGGLPGAARLFGPTGGYLIAYPFAAALVGWVTASPRRGAALLGALLGILAIHAGGLAQLMVITGSIQQALVFGTVPFIIGDLAKVAVAALVIRRGFPHTRALR
jgi:biotin transport system substrate-specific component